MLHVLHAEINSVAEVTAKIKQSLLERFLKNQIEKCCNRKVYGEPIKDVDYTYNFYLVSTIAIHYSY